MVSKWMTGWRGSILHRRVWDTLRRCLPTRARSIGLHPWRAGWTWRFAFWVAGDRRDEGLQWRAPTAGTAGGRGRLAGGPSARCVACAPAVINSGPSFVSSSSLQRVTLDWVREWILIEGQCTEETKANLRNYCHLPRGDWRVMTGHCNVVFWRESAVEKEMRFKLGHPSGV